MNQEPDLSMVIDEDGPAEKFAFTKDGQKIDLANVSGRRKVDLIQSGQFRIDQFVNPSNMPGKKLAAMRQAHRERVEEMLKAAGIVVGSRVMYKDVEYEVLATDGKSVLIPKDGKKVRVKIDKVTHKVG